MKFKKKINCYSITQIYNTIFSYDAYKCSKHGCQAEWGLKQKNGSKTLSLEVKKLEAIMEKNQLNEESAFFEFDKTFGMDYI